MYLALRPFAFPTWRRARLTLACQKISGQFGITVMGLGTKQIMAYVGIFNAVMLAVFIYACAPASGGHMNPLITWSTFWCGLCPAPRGKQTAWEPTAKHC